MSEANMYEGMRACLLADEHLLERSERAKRNEVSVCIDGVTNPSYFCSARFKTMIGLKSSIVKCSRDCTTIRDIKDATGLDHEAIAVSKRFWSLLKSPIILDGNKTASCDEEFFEYMFKNHPKELLLHISSFKCINHSIPLHLCRLVRDTVFSEDFGEQSFERILNYHFPSYFDRMFLLTLKNDDSDANLFFRTPFMKWFLERLIMKMMPDVDGMFLEWNYFPFYPQRLSGSGSASLTGFVYHRFHKNLVPSMGMDFTPELFAQNMCRFYRLGFDYVFHETIIYTLICRKDVAAETILDLINNNAALILSHGRVGHRIVTDYLPIHVWKYLSDCLIDENLRNILL